ncbi:MAG: hypothetical protein VX335_03710 [Pseudomonadota bacterium]|nr:hypothetical protein [Pseudomonadota bacterium]
MDYKRYLPSYYFKGMVPIDYLNNTRGKVFWGIIFFLIDLFSESLLAFLGYYCAFHIIISNAAFILSLNSFWLYASIGFYSGIFSFAFCLLVIVIELFKPSTRSFVEVIGHAAGLLISIPYSCVLYSIPYLIALNFGFTSVFSASIFSLNALSLAFIMVIGIVMLTIHMFGIIRTLLDPFDSGCKDIANNMTSDNVVSAMFRYNNRIYIIDKKYDYYLSEQSVPRLINMLSVNDYTNATGSPLPKAPKYTEVTDELISSLMSIINNPIDRDNFITSLNIYHHNHAVNVANELNNNSVGQIADNTDNIVADTVNLLNTENGANSATYNGEEGNPLLDNEPVDLSGYSSDYDSTSSLIPNNDLVRSDSPSSVAFLSAGSATLSKENKLADADTKEDSSSSMYKID